MYDVTRNCEWRHTWKSRNTCFKRSEICESKWFIFFSSISSSAIVVWYRTYDCFIITRKQDIVTMTSILIPTNHMYFTHSPRWLIFFISHQLKCCERKNIVSCNCSQSLLVKERGNRWPTYTFGKDNLLCYCFMQKSYAKKFWVSLFKIISYVMVDDLTNKYMSTGISYWNISQRWQ